MDVKFSFWNGDLMEEVYVDQPLGLRFQVSMVWFIGWRKLSASNLYVLSQDGLMCLVILCVDETY